MTVWVATSPQNIFHLDNMANPTRNTSTYTNPAWNTGVLLKEDGFALLTEDGNEKLLENPANNPNLTTRNSSSYTLPSRN